jgi:hypothetical protein
MLILITRRNGNQVCPHQGIGHQGVAEARRMLVGQHKEAVIGDIFQKSTQGSCHIGGGNDLLLTHHQSFL